MLAHVLTDMCALREVQSKLLVMHSALRTTIALVEPRLNVLLVPSLMAKALVLKRIVSNALQAGFVLIITAGNKNAQPAQSALLASQTQLLTLLPVVLANIALRVVTFN